MSQELYKKNNQAGFTFVEMIISLTVFLVAVAAIFALLKIATLQKRTAGNRTDQIQSARLALEYMRRDSLNAGFGYHRTGGNAPDNVTNSLFNIPADLDIERDLITSIISGNNVNSNTLSGVNTDFIAFLSRDPNFNNGNLINYDSATPNGNVVELNTPTGEATNSAVNQVYLIEPKSGTTQILAMVTGVTGGNRIRIAAGDPLGLNQPATGTGEGINLLMTKDEETDLTNNGEGSIKRVNIVSYSVTSDGTLLRKVYGNQTGTSQVETRELVYGVSNLQIRYFMEDGTIVDSPSNNQSGRTNQQKMNSIVQVQFSVTIIPASDNTNDASSTPITIKEYVSTRNLRYEAS